MFARMSNPYSAQLVSIEGADAVSFAQAQFSSNLADLTDDRWQFSSWLDAQGRVRAFFHLMRLDGQRLLLLLRGGEAAAIADELRRYVFRMKVRVEAAPVQPLGMGAPLAQHTVRRDEAQFALGCGSHSLVVGEHGDDAWRLPELRAGWPWLTSALLGELLPAALGLDALGATALDKGCYPGQEIVARMHYRGGNKRHLRRLWLSRPLPAGSVLHAGNLPPLQLLDVVALDDGAEAQVIAHEDALEHLREGLHATCEASSVEARSIDYAPCTSGGAT